MHYLRVNVLHTVGYPDSTNNGVTHSAPDKLVVPCERGDYTEAEVIEHGLIVLVVMNTKIKHYVVQSETRRGGMGGNFIWSTDSRFRDMHPYPVPVHDRFE